MRERAKSRLAGLSLLLNVVLTAAKAAVGLVLRSDALLADAAHSGADVAGSIAVLIGLNVARRPADREHPYGHGKAEVIAASLVAILLVLAGLDVVWTSGRAFFSPAARPHWVAFAVALAAAALKEWMYHYQLRAGRALASPALTAGAADHRSDVYSSLAAAAGIGLALIGQYTGVGWLLYADPLAGLLVAAVVVRIGYRLALDSFAHLMDQVVDADTTDSIGRLVSRIEGVQSLDDIRVRSAGPYWMVDVKIGVDPEISVRAGHDVARVVKRQVIDEYRQVRDVLVHVNPHGEDDGDDGEGEGGN
jgi:cation diffusion facilitator family transporter